MKLETIILIIIILIIIRIITGVFGTANFRFSNSGGKK